MIPDFFLGLLNSALTTLIKLLPSWSEPSALTSGGTFRVAMHNLAGGVGGYGAFVPWAVAIDVYGACIALLAIYYTVRVLAWVWARVPVVGGGD